MEISNWERRQQVSARIQETGGRLLEIRDPVPGNSKPKPEHKKEWADLLKERKQLFRELSILRKS